MSTTTHGAKRCCWCRWSMSLVLPQNHCALSHLGTSGTSCHCPAGSSSGSFSDALCSAPAGASSCTPGSTAAITRKITIVGTSSRSTAITITARAGTRRSKCAPGPMFCLQIDLGRRFQHQSFWWAMSCLSGMDRSQWSINSSCSFPVACAAARGRASN